VAALSGRLAPRAVAGRAVCTGAMISISTMNLSGPAGSRTPGADRAQPAPVRRDIVMTTLSLDERTRWGVVALGFCAGIVGMFQTAKMTVVLVDIQRDIGLSLVTASLSLTAVSLTGALLGIQAGRVASEFGVVRTLVIALLLSAVAGVGTALLSDPVAFLVARLVEGLGYLLVCAAAPAMMAQHAAPRDKGVALAIWGAFVPISVSLMAFFGPLVAVSQGWRVLFLASAATALAMAGVIALAVRDGPRPPGGPLHRFANVVRGIPGDYAALYGSARSLGLGVAFMAFAAMQVGFIALQPAFLVAARGMDIITVGLIVTATTPFAILGTVIAGVLQRLEVPEPPTALVAFAAMLATATASFMVAPEVIVLLAIGAGFYTAGGVVAAVVFASLPQLATATTGIALLSGLLVQFGNVGALLGAPILAAVADRWSWAAAPLALAAMAALGAAGVLATRR
jgi:MFS family permease